MVKLLSLWYIDFPVLRIVMNSYNIENISYFEHLSYNIENTVQKCLFAHNLSGSADGSLKREYRI